MNITYLVLAMLLLLWTLHKLSTLSTERFADVGDTSATMFVSIASYRDEECSRTLQNMFEQADNPTRVFAGVCEQNKTGTVAEQCVGSEVLKQRKTNIRIITLDHTQAKGPTYARYLCSTLYRNEDYFVQIDSHTRFVKGWDSKIIAMLGGCPTQPAVLTHYAPDIVASTSSWDESSMVPVLCDADFNNDGIPVLKALLRPAMKGLYRPTPFVSGNFWAARGTVLADCPFDPDLPHLFQGEELLLSARLWTSGYDFYSPTRNLVMHEYGRKNSPKFWDLPGSREQQVKTLEKVKWLLGLSTTVPSTPISPVYGLGHNRSLSQYYKFARVDVDNRQVASRSAFCPT